MDSRLPSRVRGRVRRTSARCAGSTGRIGKLLATFGPTLSRPHADTLSGSRHANMKELRFNAGDGVWRVAFAFDPVRNGIVLVTGDKAGVTQKRFYKALIAKADARFAEHLDILKGK